MTTATTASTSQYGKVKVPRHPALRIKPYYERGKRHHRDTNERKMYADHPVLSHESRLVQRHQGEGRTQHGRAVRHDTDDSIEGNARMPTS